MKIKAIWERPGKQSGIFLLLDDGQLLHLVPETVFEGKDREGNLIYRETGSPDYSSAFNKEDRFDFLKADWLLRHYSGVLVLKEA